MGRGPRPRRDEAADDVRGLVAALAAGAALDAAYGCAKDCIQILGGTGFTWEHDAHLHLRRAVVARQLLGAGDAHRLRAVRLAESGARRELRLDLPAEADAYRERTRAVVGVARGLDPAPPAAPSPPPDTRRRTCPRRTGSVRGPSNSSRSRAS